MRHMNYAALSFELAADAAKPVRVIPAGRFRSADGSGRPATPAEGWLLDEAGAAALIARAKSRSDRKLIDYEHQSMRASEVAPAPAAGWFADLEWRNPTESDPGGLYVTPEWTPRAAAMIADREYRYLSPLFSYDATTGRVLDLVSVGLVNQAGLDGLADLAALAAIRFPSPLPLSRGEGGSHSKEDVTMIPKPLLAALAVADTATEAEALTALAALKTERDALKTEIAALKTAAPDPAKFVPVEAVAKLQEQLAALSADMLAKEVDSLVEAALADGRLPADLKDWAASLGKTNLAALKDFCAKAKPVAALAGMQTGNRAPAAPAGATLTRAQFVALSAEDQMKQVGAGVSIVD